MSQLLVIYSDIARILHLTVYQQHKTTAHPESKVSHFKCTLNVYTYSAFTI